MDEKLLLSNWQTQDVPQKVNGKEEETEDSAQRYIKYGAIATGVVILVALLVWKKATITSHAELWFDEFIDWCVDTLGMGSCVLFGVLAGLCAMGGPSPIVTLGAGVTFQRMYGDSGVLIAIASVCIGMQFGCMASFQLGRYCLKDRVQKIIQADEKLVIVEKVISESGWQFAFVVRLNPFIPFALVSYAFSATNMSFTHNAFSCPGSWATAVMQIYIAATGAKMARSSDSSHEVIEGVIKVVVGLALSAAIAAFAVYKYNAKVAELEAAKEFAKEV